MNRDPNKTCSNCPYWHKLPEPAVEGQCRDQSPQLVQLTTGNAITRWPETLADEWCRRHPNLFRKDIP